MIALAHAYPSTPAQFAGCIEFPGTRLLARLEHRLRIALDHIEEHERKPRRLSVAPLPMPQCRDRPAEAFSELLLRHADALTQPGDVHRPRPIHCKQVQQLVQAANTLMNSPVGTEAPSGLIVGPAGIDRVVSAAALAAAGSPDSTGSVVM